MVPMTAGTAPSTNARAIHQCHTTAAIDIHGLTLGDRPPAHSTLGRRVGRTETVIASDV